MEWTVKRISEDTFKIEGEIEIRFTQNEMQSEIKMVLEKELEKHRAWLKDTLKTNQEKRSAKPPKRLLSIKETAQYLGISPRTLYNRTGRRSMNPFPVKPKRVGRRVRFDIVALNRYIDSL